MEAHTDTRYNSYSSTVVAAFDVLSAFDETTTDLGIRELSRKLDKPKSSIFRLVTTLHHLGLLEQDPITEKYRIGFKLFELGILWLRNVPFRDRIHGHLSDLVEHTRETAYIAVLNGNDTAVYIDKVQSPQAVRVGSPIGRPVSLADSAIGRALLAYLPDEHQARIIANCQKVKRTPNSITDPEALRGFLASSTELGYFLDDEEAEIGLRCVAVPILGRNGEPLASICVSGPSARIPLERVPEIAEAVKRVALAASKQLAHVEEHDGILA